MKSFRQKPNPFYSASQTGLTLTELVVSVAAGTLLITGGAAAMRSVGSSMQTSGQASGLRSSAITGLRLLRAETQRSLHLMVKGGTAQEGQTFSDLDHDEYASARAECQALSADQDEVFNPIFGMRMAEVNTPVLYGLGTAKGDQNYALFRCGPTLNGHGKYETVNVVLSRILENIGITPCTTEGCSSGQDLREVVAGLNNSLTDYNKSLTRAFPQPAFAIETDPARKLLKITDPTSQSDSIQFSFLQPPGSRRDLRVDLDFMAYARADKVNRSDDDFLSSENSNGASEGSQGLDSCSDDGNCNFFGIPVSSEKLKFIVDGSGSMSSCIAWGSTFGDVERTYFDGSTYIKTRRTCHLTRMESLQSQLRGLIGALGSNTEISLQAFSSGDYLNNKSWEGGKMMPLTDDNRQDALKFINSLSDGKVTRWGGTRPWKDLNLAMEDENANTIFFMTDGDPNYDRYGGRWDQDDYAPTANAYIRMNDKRDSKIIVNTVSVGQQSEWLELLSSGVGGVYKVIDQ